MFDGIQAAQKKLEEKRAELLKPTTLTPIGSEPEVDLSFVCKCGNVGELAPFWLQVYGAEKIGQAKESAQCADCEAREREEHEAEEERRKVQQKEEWRRECIERDLKGSGIPGRFIGVTFDDYEPPCKAAKETADICRQFTEEFAKESGKCLTLIGSCGTGKSMLTAATGQAIIHRGFSFKYTTAMKIVRAIKETWNDRETTEQRAINSFIYPDVLAIEEIGVQFGSATEQLYLTEIVNERYEQRKSTILISNLTIPQLEDCIGKRAVDRMYEDGKVLVFNWQSYRRQR